MSEFSQEVKNIFVKPASAWTNEEGAKVFKLMQEHGKESVKQALEEARANSAKAELAIVD